MLSGTPLAILALPDVRLALRYDAVAPGPVPILWLAWLRIAGRSLNSGVVGGMTIRRLITQTVAVGLLLLTGCEASRNMRDDLLRLTSSQSTAQKSQPAKSVTSTRPRTTPPASTTDAAAVAVTATSDEPPAGPAATATSDEPPARPAATLSPALSLAGKSETELRAMLGTPTSEEDRPPGKRWRYRDGQCTLDVQLYPDVQTKQFGTLAYEVKSDDNTDEGKRVCLAQLQSRAQARH
jgi:hypothetical protein